MTGPTTRLRKRGYYTKLQSPFLWRDTALLLKPNEPPPWWRWLGYAEEAWPIAVKEARKLEAETYLQSLNALFDHFGIVISALGAFEDLALSLAYRHERALLVQGKRISYSALCKRFDLNPDTEDADQRLALALAEKYVWAEKDKADDWATTDRGTRLSTLDFAHLVLAVVAVKEDLKRRGKRRSARAIADALRDKRALAKIIPQKAADSVLAALKGRSNKDKSGKPMSPESWLRHALIPTVLNPFAPTKIAANRSLRVQLYCDVLPLLFKKPAEREDGQNSPHFDRRKRASALPT